MMIKEASEVFETFLIDADKSERKIFKAYVSILFALQNMILTENELQSIELKLDSFSLKRYKGDRELYYKKRLILFKKYLKKEHALIAAGYYTERGVGYGIFFGIMLSLIIGLTWNLNVDDGYGLLGGMLIGLCIGSYLDAREAKLGRVIHLKK